MSGNVSTANLFASKFESVLNTHSPSLHDNLHSSVQSSITSLHMDEVHFSDTEVLEALSQLKSHKFDNYVLSSEHLKLVSPAIAKHLAVLFTSVVRHGYLPRCLSDCVLIPIPKSNKDASCSSNYRAITLASTLSETLEHFSYFSTSLQFGFKPGSSTTLCTGVYSKECYLSVHSQRFPSYGLLPECKQSF